MCAHGLRVFAAWWPVIQEFWLMPGHEVYIMIVLLVSKSSDLFEFIC
jgi:hypothetical protein